MGKPKRKEPERDPNVPLNDVDIMDSRIMGAGCYSYPETPAIGLLIVDTPIGHYAFALNQRVANEMIQQLREFIAGESEPLGNNDD